MSDRGTRHDGGSRASILKEALAGQRPDLEVLASDLEFDGGPRVELVGADARGRLFVALWIERADDASVLRVVDALAWTRRSASALAAHLARESIDVEAPPVAVAIGTQSAAELAERLAPLLGSALEVYLLRSLRTSLGSTHSLHPLAGTSASELELPALTEEGFAALLAAPQRELVRDLSAKLRRIDERIAFSATAREASWEFRGQHLARVRPESGSAAFRAGVDGRERELLDGDAVAAAVEDVLTLYVGRLEDADDVERPVPDAEERPVGRARDALERFGASTPALTPEEIAAFRD